jgi:hypothetical protein
MIALLDGAAGGCCSSNNSPMDLLEKNSDISNEFEWNLSN